MSKQDEAFEAWLTEGIEDDLNGRCVAGVAQIAWDAALRSVTDALELARRVEALPPDYELWHNALTGRWEVVDVANQRFTGESPLAALRAAGIGDEEA